MFRPATVDDASTLTPWRHTSPLPLPHQKNDETPYAMKRSTILALLLVYAQRGGVYGYSTLSSIWSPTLHQQRASYFVGRVVLSSSSSPSQRSASSSSMIEMKKGKANLPSHMRSQYKRSQEMEAYRQQMIESQVSKRYPTPQSIQ